MKKISILLAIILLFTKEAFSQSLIWEKLPSESFIITSLLRSTEGSIVAAGKDYQPDGVELSTHTSSYDIAGNQLWRTPRGRIVVLNNCSITQTKDGRFITGDHVYKGFTNKRDSFLQQIEVNGDTSLTWPEIDYFTPDTTDEILSILTLPGSDLLLSGLSYPESTALRSFYMRRVDSAGNTIWYKHFAKSINTYGAVATPNRRGNFVLYSTLSRPSVFPLVEHPYLMEISADGDSLLGKKVVVFDSTKCERALFKSNNLVEAANGDYIFSGMVEDCGSQNRKSFIARVDSAFNLIWGYQHPMQSPQNIPAVTSKVVELEDGTILLLTRDMVGQSGVINLVRVSSAGQFISQTSLQGIECPNSLIEPWDWVFLPDSSIVISGRCVGNGTSEGYIGRWGNLGLPTIATPVTRAEDIESYKANLDQSYPNPNTGSATIPYILPTAASRASIELRELVTGRLVGTYQLPVKAGEAQIDVNLDRIISGNYVYSLIVDGAGIATGKMVVIK